MKKQTFQHAELRDEHNEMGQCVIFSTRRGAFLLEKHHV